MSFFAEATYVEARLVPLSLTPLRLDSFLGLVRAVLVFAGTLFPAAPEERGTKTTVYLTPSPTPPYTLPLKCRQSLFNDKA